MASPDQPVTTRPPPPRHRRPDRHHSAADDRSDVSEHPYISSVLAGLLGTDRDDPWVDPNTTEDVAALLGADAPGGPQFVDVFRALCAWHETPLTRRTRLRLSLAVACPACRAKPPEYCRSHTKLLQPRVHHERATG